LSADIKEGDTLLIEGGAATPLNDPEVVNEVVEPPKIIPGA
jgi:hypothetical protein